MLKASNGFWLPEEAANAKTAEGGTSPCIVDIVISDMQWFCDLWDTERAAEEGGQTGNRRPGALSKHWNACVVKYLMGTFTECLAHYLVRRPCPPRVSAGAAAPAGS